MQNEKGEAQLITIIIVFALSNIIIISLKGRVLNFKELREKQNTLLCIKQINGETKNFINYIDKINRPLKILTIAKFTSILVPGIGTVTQKSSKTAIKALKKLQSTALASYVKNTQTPLLKYCPSKNIKLLSPYKLAKRGLFKRDKFNQTIFKGRRWEYFIYAKKFYIKTIFSPQGKSKSYMGKTALFSLL